MAAHAKMIGWAAARLEQESVRTSVIAETPYSTVIKIECDDKSVYLKQTPPELFIEADILSVCRHRCGITAIPELIASNRELNCFLMTSCGDTSLRRLCGGNTERTDVKPDIDLAVRALTLYREMQQATAPQIDYFLELGVPDWRLNKLPNLYRQLVNDTVLLQEYGLNAVEIAAMRALTKTIADQCATLDAFGIKACLNLSDLHDDNMMLDTKTGQISIIDWGESTITHPLLSLTDCLGWFERAYKIDKTSQDYRRLFEACFSGWPIQDALTEALGLADHLSLLYWVFSKQRLAAAVGRQAMNGIDQMDSRIKNVLLIFLARMTDKDPALYKADASGVF